MRNCFFFLFVSLFCVRELKAQQLLVTYQQPLQYQKTGGRLMAAGLLHYTGSKKDLSVEVDGKRVAYHLLSDSLISIGLPLIGTECDIQLKVAGKLIDRQKFAPVIPADWGYFKNGTIDIINTSHQDIAWMNTPDSCKEERIKQIIIPALEIAEKKPGFCFGMEQALNLREILDEYPSYKNIIREAYQKKRFSWGATFNQPYEGLESDEQLIRELYLGRKWIRDQFNGQVDSRTAFNMDVPGRSLQFPQILNKAGVKYLVVSRMKEGFFNWYSPDGSRVLTYSPGNYGWASMFYKYFNRDAPEAMYRLSRELKNWNAYYSSRHIPPHFAVVISNDAAGPVYYEQVVEEWNKIAAQAETAIPRLRYSTAEDFLSSLDVPDARFDSISGERPNLWLYIHGPAHYEAIKAKREAGIHLPAAEMFNTIEGLLENNFSLYPKAGFDSAWYKSIYDDHGWGGKHGEITDSIFGAGHHQANALSKRLLMESLVAISGEIKFPQKNSWVVFNDLSWQRSGIAAIVLPWHQSSLCVRDVSGKPLVSQATVRGDSTELKFMADSVPSVGYITVYLAKKKAPARKNHTALSNYCENGYYKIYLGRGGITGLFDKSLGKDILNTTRFAGGDVMDLGYNGNGAGEFTEITETNMANFDKLSNHKTRWELKEDGDLFSVFQADYVLNGVEIIQRIVVYHQLKKIGFEYDIPDWKGVKNRQLRFALPLHADEASVSYEVPMGVSTVGESELKMKPGGWAWGGTYRHNPSETHPREVQDFVSANAKDFGLTLSTGTSVFDWIDPTVDAVTYPVIQAIMLSSHKSCHSEGNWYLQKGAHQFRFSITTHPPGWKNGYAFGIGSNHEFYTVPKKDDRSAGKLPASMSFIKTSSPFLKVTAFKKGDAGDQAVIRFVDMSGESGPASVQFFKPFQSADRVDLIEEVQQKNEWEHSNTISMDLKKNSIESYQIHF